MVQFLLIKGLNHGAEVVTMGCCSARTSVAEAGDQEFQSGPRYHSLTAVGLAYDMDSGHVFLDVFCTRIKS